MDKDKRSSVISDITVERLDNRSARICWKTEPKDLGVSVRYGNSPTGSDAPSGQAVRFVGVNSAEVSGLDPDRLPQSSTIRYLNLPITHGEFDFVSAVERIKKGDDSWLTEDFMLSGYIHNLDEFAHTWGEVIRRLIEPKNRPLLFHCTGGKDRAGTCAALILLALGVPEETVIDDHQLSNILIADLAKYAYKRIASYGVDPRKLSPYFTAPLECIIALLDHLHKTYVSPVDYLETAAGLNRETLSLLKEALLE